MLSARIELSAVITQKKMNIPTQKKGGGGYHPPLSAKRKALSMNCPSSSSVKWMKMYEIRHHLAVYGNEHRPNEWINMKIGEKYRPLKHTPAHCNPPGDDQPFKRIFSRIMFLFLSSKQRVALLGRQRVDFLLWTKILGWKFRRAPKAGGTGVTRSCPLPAA